MSNTKVMKIALKEVNRTKEVKLLCYQANNNIEGRSRGRDIIPEELDYSKYVPYIESQKYLMDTNQYQPDDLEDDYINENGRSKRILIPRSQSVGHSQLAKSNLSKQKFDKYMQEIDQAKADEYNVKKFYKKISKVLGQNQSQERLQNLYMNK